MPSCLLTMQLQLTTLSLLRHNIKTWAQEQVASVFSSPSGLHSDYIDLAMKNNTWCLFTPRCDTKTIYSSTVETVNALTSALQCKCWHHRLSHRGKEALRLASAA